MQCAWMQCILKLVENCHLFLEFPGTGSVQWSHGSPEGTGLEGSKCPLSLAACIRHTPHKQMAYQFCVRVGMHSVMCEGVCAVPQQAE